MRRLLFSSLLLFSFFLLAVPSYAHQSGCHRWHSCPSDTGSYVCGDWGYCSYCPDNQYCKNGRIITSSISNTTSSQPTLSDSSIIQHTSPPNTSILPYSANTTTTTITGATNSTTSTIMTCKSGYIEEYKCVGDYKYRKYQYSNCNIDWFYAEYCLYGCSNGNCLQKPVETAPSQNITITSIECRGTFEGIVEKIIDGDTLAIKDCDKNIRLSLVDTPEKNNIGYTEAKDFISNLCFAGSTAFVDEDDGQKEGSYNRIVAVVYCQNKNINAEILSNSLGKIDTRFCSISEFGREEWAKKYGCDTKINTSSLNKKSLPNTSIGISKPSNDIVDKTVLVDALFSLEQVKIKLDILKDSATTISDYYSGKGDTAKAGKWLEISNTFNGVINTIYGITLEIKQNKDNITADFIQKIKGDVGGVKADISSVIDKVIEVL